VRAILSFVVFVVVCRRVPPQREREREMNTNTKKMNDAVLLTSRRREKDENEDEEGARTRRQTRKTTTEEEKVRLLEAHVEDTRATSEALIQWCDETTLERFLRADKGNLDKAKARLKSTLLWRRDEMNSFCKCCFEDDSRSHYMHVVGRTKNGRPVVFSDIGLARNSKPKDNEAHATFCMEQVEKCLPKYPDDTYVWVSDFHKFGRQHLNPSVAKKVLGLFAKHYPERMGAMVFVEAPKIFNILYKICEKFVDPTTMAKLRFVRGPTGLGGGNEFRSLLEDGYCDKDTFEWIEREMMENRLHWDKVSEEKSWTKSHARNDGKYYYTNPEHDIRGSNAFIQEPFCVEMHAFCKKHVNMTTCLPLGDNRRVPVGLIAEEEEEEEEEEFALSKIIERGDSVSSMATLNVALEKMKIIEGEEEEEEEFYDCREKFKKNNVVKAVIKKLSPSKNRRRSSRIAAMNRNVC